MRVINKLIHYPFPEDKMKYLTRLETRLDPLEMVEDIEFLLESIPRDYWVQIEIWPWSDLASDSELVEAIRYGEIHSVRTLVEAGSDVNSTDSYGRPVLIMAAQRGHTEIVQILTDNGADVNASLMKSAHIGYPEVVMVLLEAGADVHAKDLNGYTALMIAAREGHDVIVEMLIEAGADANARDGEGHTALWYARMERHYNIVELLRQAGAME
jgi:ankyrin repeat protein